MLKTAVAVAALALAIASAACAQERLPGVPPAQYDADQKKAAEAFQAERKTPVFGPFSMLIRNPELMTATRSMGDYLRFKPAIGTTLSEFVILVTSREWSQSYEWNIHAPIALKQGIDKAVIDAVAAGRRPEHMTDDEAICYDFTTELHTTKQVSDATYNRALKRFGEKGVLDLAAIGGYYTFQAMTMNTARTTPDGDYRLPPLPAH